MPALAACAALLQAAVALLNAKSYQLSSFTLLSGIAALGLFLALLGDRVLLASVQGGFALAQAAPERRGAFRAKDKELVRVLAKNMEEKDPWVLLSRPTEWDDAMVEQGFGPRACERRARKTNYILLGVALLAGFVFLVMGGGVNGSAAALTAVLCMGSPLSSTLITGLASLRLQQTAAASGAVVPGWSAIEELGGVDTVQADADELFTPDSALLEDIRIFKGRPHRPCDPVCGQRAQRDPRCSAGPVPSDHRGPHRHPVPGQGSGTASGTGLLGLVRQ